MRKSAATWRAMSGVGLAIHAMSVATFWRAVVSKRDSGDSLAKVDMGLASSIGGFTDNP